MEDFSIQHIRNIGIAAHIDAGKTTTTERILFYSGVLHKLGEVHEGTATTDWMIQERERGITITAAAISCTWKSTTAADANLHQINIIDTPGHVDFTVEVERSLRVLDGVVALFCAVAGVQPQSETVWQQIKKYKVPRLIFINKMDRLGANFFDAILDIKNKLESNIFALFLPIGEGKEFKGLIDIILNKAFIYSELGDKTKISFIETSVPLKYKALVDEYRENIVEYVANYDDSVMAKYINNEIINSQLLKSIIRKLIINLKFVGVIPGSSFTNKGVQMLLDSIIDYLPSPNEVSSNITAYSGNTNLIINPNVESYAIGLIFKLWTDSFIGKLVFFRLYSGKIFKGCLLYNPRTKRKEKVSRIVILKANVREDVNYVLPGNICALVGLKNVITGDTLLSIEENIILERPTFPQPVISIFIEPETKSDQEKLSLALKRLSDEDPTFKVKFNLETSQTLIFGMGELHLEIIKDRLLREFQIKTISGKPQIAYKETITLAADGEGKYIKQSGGRGQYGHVILRVDVSDRSSGVTVINKISGGSIPKEFIKPTISGINEALKEGVVRGYPVIDLKITILDGSFHEVDSSEFAFKMAGNLALKNALKSAGSVLLEPIMKVDVYTPKEFQGDVVADINRKRGIVENIHNDGKYFNIRAFIPLENMFGYATHIRSLSQGRASYSMTPSHFSKAPINV